MKRPIRSKGPVCKICCSRRNHRDASRRRASFSVCKISEMVSMKIRKVIYCEQTNIAIRLLTIRDNDFLFCIQLLGPTAFFLYEFGYRGEVQCVELLRIRPIALFEILLFPFFFIYSGTRYIHKTRALNNPKMVSSKITVNGLRS